MKQIEEIVKSLENWQKEDGPAKRSFILFCVDGIDGDKCKTAVLCDPVDLTASIARAMLEDKRIEFLIKGATVVASDFKEKFNKKKKKWNR